MKLKFILCLLVGLLATSAVKAQASPVDPRTSVAPNAKPEPATGKVRVAKGVAIKAGPVQGNQPAPLPTTIGAQRPFSMNGGQTAVSPVVLRTKNTTHMVDPETPITGADEQP